jgi:hypothetical protein
MQQPPSEPDQAKSPERRTTLSRWREWSTGARFAIALLAAAVLVASAVAVIQFRQTSDLEQRLAEQERRTEDLSRSQENRENPLEELFGESSEELFGGENSFGSGGASDPTGLSNPNILRCLTSGSGIGLGGLFGGGNVGDLEDLFGGGSGADDAEKSPRELVSSIKKKVAKLRELRFKEPVDVSFLTDAQLNRRVTQLFAKEYSSRDAELEGRILEMLGAVPRGSDMRALREEALEGQVAGFYVPETGELVVGKTGGGGPSEQVTLAHELEHALADQNFDLPVESETDPARADADLAELSVIEGDATLTMQKYSLLNLGLSEQLEMASDPSVVKSQAQLERMPNYLRQELLFPYIDGMNFVCDRFRDGGWKAVDRAYARPPASSDQLLFPERYDPSARPAVAPSLAHLPSPWTSAQTRSMGAAELKWLFAAPGDDADEALSDPLGAAKAWAGGEVELWMKRGDSALGVSLVDRGGDLCGSIETWYDAAIDGDDDAPKEDEEAMARDGNRQDAALECSDNEVRLAIAPSLDLARTLLR